MIFSYEHSQETLSTVQTLQTLKLFRNGYFSLGRIITAVFDQFAVFVNEFEFDFMFAVRPTGKPDRFPFFDQFLLHRRQSNNELYIRRRRLLVLHWRARNRS